jgi:Protein of unknown function (DUF3775)
MKLSETANEVMALANAIQEYWNTELPKRHPNYPLVRPGDEDGPPPPQQKELEHLLASLPEDVLYQLAFLVYLGKGYFVAKDLASHYEEVKQRVGTPEEAVSELADTASLGDSLEFGLEKLKRQSIDVDHLTFALASSGS